MKIRALFLFLLSFYATSLFSFQGHYGVLGGVNIANLTTEPDEGFVSRTAFALGGYYELRLSELVGLSPEFFLIGKGGFRTTDNITFKMNYFEIPFLIKLHFAVKRLGAILFAGPSIALMTSSSAVLETGEEGVVGALYPNEMGFQFGGGVEIPVNHSLGILVNARYAMGLTDISQTASNTKHKGLYIFAGVSIRPDDEDVPIDTESRAKEYLEKKFGTQ